VERLVAIWRGLRRGDVFPIGLVCGFLGMRSHLLAPDRLRALLERNLPVARLEDAKIPCHVVATDVLSGEEACLSSGSEVQAVLASAAIPAVFPSVRIAGRQLSDGALASNTPLAEIERRHILRVLERMAGNRKETARVLGIGTNTLWRKLGEYAAPARRRARAR
jgi:NTE family protein